MRNKINLSVCVVITFVSISCGCVGLASPNVETVHAAPATVAENTIPLPDLAPQALRSVGMVLLFLGVLLAASWYVRKRSGSFSLHNSKRIKVLDRAILDMRHSVVLISVDGANYLIGVAPQAITAVAEVKPLISAEQGK